MGDLKSIRETMKETETDISIDKKSKIVDINVD